MTDQGIFLSAAASLVVLALVVGFFAIKEEVDWQAYAANHCKKIGTITGSSSMGVGIGTNGSVSMVPVYVPGKTGYLCDNGQQVWR